MCLPAGGHSLARVSHDAWLHLRWLVPNEAGAPVLYPAEIFGPLPEVGA